MQQHSRHLCMQSAPGDPGASSIHRDNGIVVSVLAERREAKTHRFSKALPTRAPNQPGSSERAAPRRLQRSDGGCGTQPAITVIDSCFFRCSLSGNKQICTVSRASRTRPARRRDLVSVPSTVMLFQDARVPTKIAFHKPKEIIATRFRSIHVFIRDKVAPRTVVLRGLGGNAASTPEQMSAEVIRHRVTGTLRRSTK